MAYGVWRPAEGELRLRIENANDLETFLKALSGQAAAEIKEANKLVVSD